MYVHAAGAPSWGHVSNVPVASPPPPIPPRAAVVPTSDCALICSHSPDLNATTDAAALYPQAAGSVDVPGVGEVTGIFSFNLTLEQVWVAAGWVDGLLPPSLPARAGGTPPAHAVAHSSLHPPP